LVGMVRGGWARAHGLPSPRARQSQLGQYKLGEVAAMCWVVCWSGGPCHQVPVQADLWGVGNGSQWHVRQVTGTSPSGSGQAGMERGHDRCACSGEQCAGVEAVVVVRPTRFTWQCMHSAGHQWGLEVGEKWRVSRGVALSGAGGQLVGQRWACGPCGTEGERGGKWVR
jgi:hypothetical protein